MKPSKRFFQWEVDDFGLLVLLVDESPEMETMNSAWCVKAGDMIEVEGTTFDPDTRPNLFTAKVIGMQGRTLFFDCGDGYGQCDRCYDCNEPWVRKITAGLDWAVCK